MATLTSSTIVFTNAILILISNGCAAPQYYEQLRPTYYVLESNDIKLITDSPTDTMQMDFWTNVHHGDGVARLYGEGNPVPEVLMTLQPQYEASQFNAEFSNENIGYSIVNHLERGRSDIDPIEDSKEQGYFYPKPSIPFELPHSVPFSGNPENVEPAEDVTVIATTLQTEEDPTEETTTASTSPQTNANPQDVTNKMEKTSD